VNNWQSVAAWGNAPEALRQHRNHGGTGAEQALHPKISPNISAMRDKGSSRSATSAPLKACTAASREQITGGWCLAGFMQFFTHVKESERLQNEGARLTCDM